MELRREIVDARLIHDNFVGRIQRAAVEPSEQEEQACSEKEEMQ
jgi:hypothetical protein